LNSTSIHVSWEPPEKANGKLIGYYIYTEEVDKNSEPVPDSFRKAKVVQDATVRLKFA